MKIVRVLNNNAVVSKNDKNEEVILLGSGIAFKKKSGDVIPDQSIEKIFTLKKSDKNRFAELISQIPYEVIQVTEEIVDYAQKQLNKKLDDSIYLLLTDHIYYAVERDKKNLSIRNKLIWEIEHFYPNEYKIGLKAVEIINEKFDAHLLTAEAGFITMHIVNASGNGIENSFDEEVKDMKAILKIVSFHFDTKLDESSMNYGRFITHIRFFLQRIYTKTSLKKIDQNDELFAIICKKYFNSYLCVEKIDKYFVKERNVEISDEEKMYLVLHIERVIEKAK